MVIYLPLFSRLRDDGIHLTIKKMYITMDNGFLTVKATDASLGRPENVTHVEAGMSTDCIAPGTKRTSFQNSN